MLAAPLEPKRKRRRLNRVQDDVDWAEVAFPAMSDDEAVCARALEDGNMDDVDDTCSDASDDIVCGSIVPRQAASVEICTVEIPQAAAQPGPRPRRLPPLAPGRSAYAEAAVKALRPCVPGCSLTVERRWHERWRVRYSAAAPPNATSKAFSNSEEEQQAILMCLRFAWQCHERTTGESCPWVWD